MAMQSPGRIERTTSRYLFSYPFFQIALRNETMCLVVGAAVARSDKPTGPSSVAAFCLCDHPGLVVRSSPRRCQRSHSPALQSKTHVQVLRRAMPLVCFRRSSYLFAYSFP
jgi:hypothetical protein